MIVIGADGCPGGWLVVVRDLRLAKEEALQPEYSVVPSFGEILARWSGAHTIAVDIPIGLPDTTGPGGRGCDTALRKVLGGRQSSVFSVPARPAVMEDDYWRSCEIAQRHSDPPRKVSKQCFHIFPKIRDVDRHMSPALQARVREVHPEAAFWAMNGCRALDEPKRVKSQPYAPGLELRTRLLQSAGFDPAFLTSFELPRRIAARDDFLDACACSWTAARIALGKAVRFPDEPGTDRKGLRMEIWA